MNRSLIGELSLKDLGEKAAERPRADLEIPLRRLRPFPAVPLFRRSTPDAPALPAYYSQSAGALRRATWIDLPLRTQRKLQSTNVCPFPRNARAVDLRRQGEAALHPRRALSGYAAWN
jgi:hypothetical protein